MHSYPMFDRATRDQNIAFARDRGFGSLAINHDTGPLVSHVPFLLDRAGTTAEIHLARSNPLLSCLEGPQPAVMAVSGPDGYVSPDWYGVENQVPTWNYVSIHLRGQLEICPVGDLRAQIDGLSAHFERRIVEKRPWTTGKMSHGVLDRMMRAIVLVRLNIASVEGTWKLGQNKPDAARLAAADRIDTGSGMELALLSALMRSVGADAKE